MRKILFFIFLMLLVSSCSKEKNIQKDVFNLAKKEIADRLKFPESAKFTEFDDPFTRVEIKYNADTVDYFMLQGFKMLGEVITEETFRKSLSSKGDSLTNDKLGNFSIHRATINTIVTAKNSFGVDKETVYELKFIKTIYKDKSEGEWELISFVSSEDN